MEVLKDPVCVTWFLGRIESTPEKQTVRFVNESVHLANCTFGVFFFYMFLWCFSDDGGHI